MSMRPQVLISLEADGTLSLDLPGTQNRDRQVPIKPGHLEATLQKVLFALALGEANIGSDGAPTVAQAKCWSQHAIWPSANCPFCRASGRFDYKNERKSTTRVVSETRRGDVVVRKLKPGLTASKANAEAKKSRSLIAAQNPEDLGL